MKLDKILKFSLSILLCLTAGSVGSLFTFPAIRTWYVTLQKPLLNPPNLIFGPVWTILYILMGIAVYLVWDKGIKDQNVRVALYLFCFQLILNTIWSIIFFGLHSPFYAFIEIIFLWLSILFTIIKFYPISNTAAFLLIPYILWVSFASFLNLSIWLLNR